MDFINQGIPLGRYFGTHVVLSFGHIIMLLYLASGARDWGVLGMGIMGLVFFLSILLHEFGHVLACRAVGGLADTIILGPMGGLAAVEPPERPFPNFVTTAGGPAVNGILLAVCWALLNTHAVAVFLVSHSMAATALLVFLVFMVEINKMLLVLNLLPIFPMDGGRLMQHVLWPVAGYRNSLVVTGMVGTVGGAALLVLGLGATSIKIPYLDYTFGGQSDYFLVFIGITCAMASWGLYQRAMQIERWKKN
jgi:Zn-dependent protease